MSLEDAELLADCANAVLARHEPDTWQHTVAEVWHFVQPQGYRSRGQGWKLHIPATPLSACLVLSRAVEVLARHRCAFKFAKSMAQLYTLVGPNADRTTAGKFITVYPNDDEHAELVAEDLHEATLGLPGQWILTDRRYRPNSQVFYRYGAFSPETVLSDDGQYTTVLRDNNGQHTSDPRGVGKAVPDWIIDPFQPEVQSRAVPTAVLVGGQFEVYKAIRQSNRGGVYVAKDAETGKDVILKRFRAHTAGATDGSDARIRARAEARLLSVLGPSGATPKLLGVFAWDGDLMVAQEFIEGMVLRKFVARSLRPTVSGCLAIDPETVLSLARQLVDLLGKVHHAGYVFGDLTPNNMMVTPDNRLVLIDLESALRSWEVGLRIGTLGYAPPESRGLPRMINPAPDLTADLYGLGACLFYLAAGWHPPGIRGARSAEIISEMAHRNPVVARLRTVLIGLLDADPAKRPSLAEVRAELLDPKPATVQPPRGPSADELIDDMLAEIAATIQPDERLLWPTSEAGAGYDSCAVHVGAAGVLLVLNQAARAGYDTSSVIRTTADWLLERLPSEHKLVPGIMFGRAGTAMVLAETGTLLADQRLVAEGLALARRLPVTWPVCDVSHGVAGAGLALLSLHKATGSDDLLQRAVQCADYVLERADIDDDVITWTATGESSFTDIRHWGFVHGVAGIGAFLLDVATATGDERYLDVASHCVRTLAGVAIHDGDAAFWPSGEDDEHADKVRLTGFCSGSNGVGTFMLRYFAATGDAVAGDLAARAAYAVHCANWISTPVWCHGLASDGEFLLDCAQVFDDARYRTWAEQTAECIAANAVRRDSRWLTPDEGEYVVPAFANGFGGPLSFLLRLKHGGERALIGSPRT